MGRYTWGKQRWTHARFEIRLARAERLGSDAIDGPALPGNQVSLGILILGVTSFSTGDPMPATMKDLGIDRLSIEDRLTLVQEIWDSIASSSDHPPLTEDQKRLLDRRIADLDGNPDTILTWEEIKARVRGPQ